ncbi:DUF560 domain-containing protein [Parahaliea sp. F7430]|uniref:DUF560 domain-containing protein n=1 Tax=Sediminihaliea albiluteola TaxID=2758564 RepID=A0A7W2YKU3_9GAMM|nr:DUF560 domain-containing protein [Sediminihaliea albiluteola]
MCCTHSQAAEQPADRPTQYSAELAVGLEYDDNVGVDELDASSSEGDYALTLGAELAMKKPLSDSTKLGLSYDFSQNLYDEFTEVNRQTHILGANLEQDFNKIDTGLSLYYIDSRLAGDSFLQLFRVSPSVSGFIGKKWFARGAYVYSEKTLENNRRRNAQTQAGEADLYFFRRGLRSYFNFGYRYRVEDATAAQFDYQSNSIKLRYVHRIELSRRPIKLEFAWRFEDRNYDGISPIINTRRKDERQRFQVDAEIPILDSAALQFYAGHGNYSSNYSPADYSQGVLGSRFIYRW